MKAEVISQSQISVCCNFYFGVQICSCSIRKHYTIESDLEMSFTSTRTSSFTSDDDLLNLTRKRALGLHDIAFESCSHVQLQRIQCAKLINGLSYQSKILKKNVKT